MAMGVSQSLDSAAWHRSGDIHGAANTNRHLRPPSKSVSFGSDTRHDYEAIDGHEDMTSLNAPTRGGDGYAQGKQQGGASSTHAAAHAMMHKAAHAPGEDSPERKKK